MIFWDDRELECIFDHGWVVGKDNKLQITKKQFENYQYTDRSIEDSSIRTLMLPSVHGCCLIFEGKHFEIIGG